MDVEVTTAFAGRARVGEGPVWDDRKHVLHWVDILAGTIHTGDPRTGSQASVSLPTLVGAAIPRRGGGFIAATAEGFVAVEADGMVGRRLTVLPAGQRMNDAKCDAVGRFWAGSVDMEFAAAQGALHVLRPDWQTGQVLDGLTLPNGLAWSLDGRTFYLVDTVAAELYAFDSQPDGPVLTNRRLIARFPTRLGMPDGMTIDAQGCLWIAMWGGDRVLRVSPEGRILLEVPMPVHQPSSCAFGGPDLDILYVTSARDGLQLDEDDIAGSVFALRGHGVRGLPAVTFPG
jgi:sugar lactone lactonase YvrE